MADIALSQESRLRFADLLISEGVTFWDLVDLPVYSSRGDEIFHFVQGGDRIDLLSYRYYGTPKLWWAIAWANDIEKIPTDINEGDVLVIPSSDYIQNTLLR